MSQRRRPGNSRRSTSTESPAAKTAEELQRVVQELETHQEEMRVQQVQLLESQEALKTARDRFEELFDFAPIAYVVLDENGLIREANLAATTLLGGDRGGLFGRPLFFHVVEDDRRRVLDHVTRCRRGEARVETDVMLKNPRDRTRMPVQLATAPLQREGFLTAIVDLSERRRGEEERARAREIQTQLRHDEQLARAASEAKDRFLAMLSHELRTPLTPILIAVDTLRQRGTLGDDAGATLDMIHRNVALETRLIDDLLDVSRIVQGKMTLVREPMDVHTLVSEVIEMMRSELAGGEIDVTLALDAEAHHVDVDPARFRQVVWNLLRNALRNTPAGGRVTISTTNLTPDAVIVCVEDTGRGIDASMLPRIFDLFEQDEEFRRRGVGLGLGLTITRTIVELHGGRISVASAGRNRGARFRVELPTVPPPESAEVVSSLPASDPAIPWRLLLVEDNEDSAAALAELLGLHGYDVRVAGSVAEALQLVADVDVVVSDLGLPDGTGYELMQLISAKRQVPAIALSGYGSQDDVRRSAEAGFRRHIVKPVEPRRLLDALAALVA